MKPTIMKTHLSDTMSRRAASGGRWVRANSRFSIRTFGFAACAAAVAAWTAGPALADNAPAADAELKLQPLEDALQSEVAAGAEAGTVFQKIELDKLVRRADWIVHADVAASESHWVSGNIETTFRVNVRESLKGDGPAQFDLTMTGGKAPGGAPVAQYVAGSAQIGEGEEVVLFLRKDVGERMLELNQKRLEAGLEPMRFSQKSKLGASPRIVGRQKGKFNVVTLENGQKLLTRVRPAPVAMDPASTEMILDALKEREDRVERLRERRLRREAEADAANLERIPKEQAGTYSPSAVTDPSAPELKNNAPKRPFIPFNADAMGRPVLFEDFKKEVARLSGQKPTVPAKADATE